MISIYKKWLHGKALQSTTQGISRAVENNEAAYRLETGIAKLAWRQVQFEISLFLSNQTKLLHTKIDPRWKKGLWLYKGIPQIGDALMDLAPRNMLQQAGLKIDLLTDTHLAKLFETDAWFNHVFDAPTSIDPTGYDFVIVPSHKRRSLKYKSALFPTAPWVSIASFYTGPEYHRGRFASQRLADLLERSVSDAELEDYSQQKLIPLSQSKKGQSTVLKIAFAIGGVDPLRTYKHWSAVGKLLALDRPLTELTLLGSRDASRQAEAITDSLQGLMKVSNLVGATDTSACRAVINAQTIFVCADGGLMHLCASLLPGSTPMLALFSADMNPAWRLPQDRINCALQSPDKDVSSIAPEQVYQKLKQYLDNQTR